MRERFKKCSAWLRRISGSEWFRISLPPKRKGSSNFNVHLQRTPYPGQALQLPSFQCCAMQSGKEGGEGRAAISLGQPSRQALAEVAAGGWR